MSIVFFDTPELANLALCAVGGSIASDDGKRALARNIKDLARISVQNAQAYNTTYSDPDPAIGATEAEIRASISCALEVYGSRLEAFLTLSSIRYNLVANNGQDFADKESLDFLLAATKKFTVAPHAGGKPSRELVNDTSVRNLFA